MSARKSWTRTSVRSIKKHASAYTLVLSLALGLVLRLYRLDMLPPGIDTQSAAVGLAARTLLATGHWPAGSVANFISPLWVALQALSISVWGHTALALLVMPALIGTLTIYTTWLMATIWFDRPTAAVAAFLVAVTPWAIGLSRLGQPFVLYPCLATLTFWCAMRLRRDPSIADAVWLSLAIMLDALAGPLGWLLVILMGVTGIYATRFIRPRRAPIQAVVLLGATVLAVAVIVYQAASYWSVLLQSLSLVTSGMSLLGSIISTLLMFNAMGDPSYLHNQSGQPMLNYFVGLMFIAGLLVVISRIHRRRYRALLGYLALLVAPCALSSASAPNAALAAAALPLVIVMAALGVGWMLALWYRTFPVNSAARTFGQAAMGLCLFLSLVEGFTQYFHAWAASPGTYLAFNEATTNLAANVSISPQDLTRYVVTTDSDTSVLAYLDGGSRPYQVVAATAIAALKPSAYPVRFWIVTDQRQAAVKALTSRFPGAVLVPHYSSFNAAEIFYTYEVVK